VSEALDLAPIGNCGVSALIDREGRYVWACLPRVDGDPAFCRLLDADKPYGAWAMTLENQVSTEQGYVRNTAVLRTVLTDKAGASIEILDLSPRHWRYGRLFRPAAYIRRVRPLSGVARLRVSLRPARNWGEAPCERTWGSNHIRFLGLPAGLRLTTNAPVSMVLDERPFRLEEELSFFLGPDEPFTGDVVDVCREMTEKTILYWQAWVRTLALPLDYQEVVIRAAIALKLCVHEDTGAIVAALTTSVPEAPASGRNWDYRYCWLRDAYYVVQALTRLSALDILERYLAFLRNLVGAAPSGHIQPVYGVGLETDLTERIEPNLAGFKGMGPVRVGNAAYIQHQHDVYGQVVLSSIHAFFDQRLLRPATVQDFHDLEAVGERAFATHDQPDAGLWEFRTKQRVHTYSALMGWAACDRLGNAAAQLGLPERADYWNGRALQIRTRIETEAWNADLGRFAAGFGGDDLDASLLQIVDLQFLDPTDQRYKATFSAIEAGLRRGAYLMRYAEPDDFGMPETAFNFCTFWFIEALHRAGRTEEARDLFEEMLRRRTHAGLLSEDMATSDGVLWGNYPQTYSLVGLINCAMMLSRPWGDVR